MIESMKAQLILLLMCLFAFSLNAQYTMPPETAEHEGTWLQWPHNDLYGPYYRGDLEFTFVEMTRALVGGENVHIVAFDEQEKDYIEQTLIASQVAMENVSFHIQPNDDCWVRDNGPIFVFDEENNLTVLDWGFNGWGNDTPYERCDIIPEVIATTLSLPVVDLNEMVLEGGAFEIDGNGSFLATKSSILGPDRNPNLSQAQAEIYLSTNLGVSNFIWLEGISGLEITDMHIDGFARFHDVHSIVCMDSLDLIYWEVPASDISTLLSATNAEGDDYDYVFLPLTQNNVITTWSQNLGYKGSYVNYYIGNEAVLVPTYNDPNDEVAISILQNLYPNREVVGIDVRNLYAGGGMIHCVTQQQPLAQHTVGINPLPYLPAELFQNAPNPFKENTNISFTLAEKNFIRLEILNANGQWVKTLANTALAAGQYTYTLGTDDLAPGLYTYILHLNNDQISSKKMVLLK